MWKRGQQKQMSGVRFTESINDKGALGYTKCLGEGNCERSEVEVGWECGSKTQKKKKKCWGIRDHGFIRYCRGGLGQWAACTSAHFAPTHAAAVKNLSAKIAHVLMFFME